MSIGENIKRLRVENDLSQYELAERIGVTQPMVAQIERGTKVLTVPLGMEIAKVLHCDLKELISESVS